MCVCVRGEGGGWCLHSVGGVEQVELLILGLELLEVHPALQHGGRQDGHHHGTEQQPQDAAQGGKAIFHGPRGGVHIGIGHDSGDGEHLVRQCVGGPADEVREHEHGRPDPHPGRQVLGAGQLALLADLPHAFVGGLLGSFATGFISHG